MSVDTYPLDAALDVDGNPSATWSALSPFSNNNVERDVKKSAVPTCALNPLYPFIAPEL